MADKGPEREDGNESLSATAMFLRSYAVAPPEPAAPSEPTPPVPAAETPRAEAGEFTRMFRSLDAEPARPVASASPVSAPVASAAPSPSGGEFTRMFGVPKTATEQTSTGQSASVKPKGFSTPGVSDSASAEGNFTRMFRPEPQRSQSRSEEPHEKEQVNFSASHAAAPAPMEASFVPEVQPREAGPQSSSFTELYRALSSEGEKSPRETAYKPEPASVTRPYAEPTPIVAPGRASQVSPSGGGVTELLNRLTMETPLMPGPPAPATAARPAIPTESPVSAVPADTRGEFTRIIQLAERKETAATPPPPPPPAAAGSALPLPKVSVTAPPLAMPVAPVAPALAVPAAPKVQITPPAITAAPAKSKLQEMLPLLLVANAFLMLVLILLVVFALHRR